MYPESMPTESLAHTSTLAECAPRFLQGFIQTPRGVITPSFHATTPSHLKFKGGYQGGVYGGGVYVIVSRVIIRLAKLQ